jgi:glucose/arabinose dehydrogenase
MKRAVVALCVTVLVAAGCGADAHPAASASSNTGSGSDDGLTAIGEGLRGVDGLQATVYARGLVNAAAMTVDAGGRLWVATAEFSDSGTDALYVVDQAGATPRAVIHLHTPLGLLWIGDTLYVASKERVDAYSAFDGTTFAATRSIVTFPAGVGELNGLALAPDGRIELGISSPCDDCQPTSDESGAIVSFLPDGTDLRVDVRHVRAPIAFAVFPGTTDVFVTMNQRDDLGDATTGDWLALVTPGQDWGFPDCFGQGGTACAGVPAPVAVLDKHAAVSGVAIVTGELGPTVGTAAIVAEWSTGVVQRVALTKQGSTYAASVAPFLTGIEHPVAVLLAPDGALLLGDWGSGTLYRITA